MLDGYERNIDYARISLTDKCNLRCVYCMPEDKVYENNLINDTLSFNDYKFIINGLSQVGIKKIKFTGGEPLLYPHLIELIKYAHYECNIDDISITTNGIGLNEIAYELKRSGLKSVNISLDSLKSYKYKSITRGGNLTDVLKSINRCLELGIKVKINCVVIKRFNDDEVYDFIEMANYYPIDVRFIELMPLGEGEYFYENGYFNISNFINDIDELYKIEDEKGFIKTTTYFERAEKEVNLDKEEAIKTATEQLTESFVRTLSNDYKIANKDVYTEDIGEGKLRVKVTFVVEQDIASVS